MTDHGSPSPEETRSGAAGSADGEAALSGISRPSSRARAGTDESVPGDETGSNGGRETVSREPGRPADVDPATASGADDTAQQSRAAELAQEDLLHRTRASVWYVGLVIAAILLILLMIFIAQNSEKVTIHFLGLSGQISLAIALVIATVVGILLVAIPGGARMYQLRKRVKGLRNAVLDD